MQRIRWALAWVGMACALAAQGQSRYCDRPVRVALFEYGVMYRADTGDGVDARWVDALSQRTGCTLQYVVMPRARIWQELERGTLDMATSAIPTLERQQYGYLLPYFRTRNLVLMRDVPAAQWNSPAQFVQSSARLGVVRSFRHEPALDDLIERLQAQGRVVEAADVQENLRLLRQGLVDVVFAQPLVYQAYLSEVQLSSLRLQDWAPPEQESVGALILSRRSFSPAQAQAWDALVAQLLKDGSLLKITQRFLPPKQARDTLYHGARPAAAHFLLPNK